MNKVLLFTIQDLTPITPITLPLLWSEYSKETSVGLGPVSVGSGGVGVGKGGVKTKGVGAKLGVKRCSCYCDVF